MPPRDLLVLTVPLKPGRCRWCGCTYHDPCPGGCGWADRAQTLCTECAGFDRLLRRATASARREAVETFNIGREAADDA
jgi:hypothetical protein